MSTDRLCNAHITINATTDGKRIGVNSFCQIRVDEDGRHPGGHVFMPAAQPVRLCTMFKENPRDGRLVRSCNLAENHAGEHEPGDVYSAVPIDHKLIGLAEGAPEDLADVISVEKIEITADGFRVAGTVGGIPFEHACIAMHELGDAGPSALRALALLVHLVIEKRIRSGLSD